MRNWFSISSPTERTRRLPRLSMSSISPRPSRRSASAFRMARMSSFLRCADRVGAVEAQPHVHLDAADARKIVALRIEEQLAEQSLGGLRRRRFAGTHHAIDVDKRLLARVVLVHRHGVADVGADIDVIDIDGDDLLEVRPRAESAILSARQLVAGFDIDLAGLDIDHVERGIAADELLVGHGDGLDAVFLPFAERAHGDLLAGLGQHLAGLGIGPFVVGLGVAHPRRLDRRRPAAVLGRAERAPCCRNNRGCLPDRGPSA